MDFEWDSEKAQENENKHGVSFSEASEVSAMVNRPLWATPITPKVRIATLSSVFREAAGTW